jgi:threonine/homoserine/homoserine lactone efflux protein
MSGVHDLWLFVLTGLLLNITPGPDIAYIVGRSAQMGTRGGVAAALGVGAGALVHTAAAAVGISAILMTSALAFTVLKWAGAAYLVYIGVQMLLARQQGETAMATAAPGANTRLRTAFLQGMLTNILNPKVALFFLAFLPQFISADAPSKVVAFVALGLLFNLTGTLWNLGVAWCAAHIASRGRGIARVGIWLERTLGAMFIAMGIRLALARQP